MKKFLYLLPIFPALFLTGCQPEESEMVIVPPSPAVRVFDLNEGPSYIVDEVGTIKPLKEVELVAQAAGVVDDLSVELGDKVSSNQTVATIDFDEINNPTRINYDNALLQLANSQQTLDESKANNQDAVVRAQIRVDSLNNTLGRLERNLTELDAQNALTQESLELQKNNVVQTSENSNISLDNLEAQFNQSWEDLLDNTEISLDTILFDLDSSFQSVENIINPQHDSNFTTQDMNKWFGASNSIQRNKVVNQYNILKDDIDEIRDTLESMLPLDESNVYEAIALVRDQANEFRTFYGEVHTMLNNSIVNVDLPQESLDAYLAVLSGAEGGVISDIAQLNSLSQALATFKLDRVSQLSTNDNNRVISDNQITEANNALLNFFSTSLAAVQDLEFQIEQTKNDLRSAQADLDSARRTAGIQNSAKDLEIQTYSNQVKLAENALEDNKIISSVQGILSELNIDEGDYVSPGTIVGKVIQTDQVKVIFYVTRENAERIKTGQEFTFYSSAGRDEEWSGTVTKIAPAADPISKKIAIEASVKNEGLKLKPEMFVDIELDLSDTTFKSTGIYVPMNAIIFGQNEQYVYVVEDHFVVEPVDILKQVSSKWIEAADVFHIYDIAEKSAGLEFNPQYELQTKFAVKYPIEIGDTFNDWVEVLSGISASDMLIVDGHRGLEENQQVMVLNSTEITE